MARLDHRWDLTPSEAIALQERIRGLVRVEPLALEQVRLVAGCDLSADRGRGPVHAGIVVWDRHTGEVVDQAALTLASDFPYVPGLLSFREVPPLLAVAEALTVWPDAVLADGQGLAHPRRCGLACHLGLCLDLPAVGCAKSVYLGEFEPPGPARGAQSPMRDRGEVVGMAVRTRNQVQPVYVSVGHRCELADAVAVTLACGRGYRLPEPSRLAHRLVNDQRRAAG